MLDISSEMYTGSDLAELNGETLNLSTYPKVINGTTYVPARVVGESLGAVVGFANGVATIVDGDTLIKVTKDPKLNFAKNGKYKLEVDMTGLSELKSLKFELNHFKPNGETTVIKPSSVSKNKVTFNSKELFIGGYNLKIMGVNSDGIEQENLYKILIGDITTNVNINKLPRLWDGKG